ncbi:MAG: 4Fe-4S binding protein [Ignavibacteriae bacterium]|nr:4Fe-4S binding protein [Ignavibacteriota bacterium]
MSVVSTIPERCKRCYCCVRECPAKAIQINRGQAVVIADRCIGCGNCVKVCSQNAKAVRNGIEDVLDSLRRVSTHERIALLAPSFPAAFPMVRPLQVVGALRELGFTKVLEVGFGADLVSMEYRHRLEHAQGVTITTPCPAVVELVEKFHPELLPTLAPIVSPMIAAGKVARERYGRDAYVVFLGPCIAKKLEILDPAVADVVDEALTFDEIIKLFDVAEVDPSVSMEREFDQPRGNLGQIYPVAGGLLKSAGMSSDAMDEQVIVVEGRDRCLNIIDEIAAGRVGAKLVDILFCEGCINGPGMHSPLSHFEKRERIIQYVRERTSDLNVAIWKNSIATYARTDLDRGFTAKPVHDREVGAAEIEAILSASGKQRVEDRLNCGACGYTTCRDLATAVACGIAEPEMCLPYTIDTLERAHRELAQAQEQLIHSEKLASVGQLAAGVAHEINNPLGTILLYAHLLLRQLKDSDPAAKDVAFVIEEANRCKTIVSSLLNFARQGKLSVVDTSADDLLSSIVAMLERREDAAKVRFVVTVTDALPRLYIDADQMKQVLLNIALNGCEAMPSGGVLTLAAAQGAQPGEIVFTISDTGIGIPKENMPRLFTPFFTTKQIGKGTGLGLPIAYGIVKMHHGHIGVRSTPDAGTTFTVTIPVDVRGMHSGPSTPAELASALSASSVTRAESAS